MFKSAAKPAEFAGPRGAEPHIQAVRHHIGNASRHLRSNRFLHLFGSVLARPRLAGDMEPRVAACERAASCTSAPPPAREATRRRGTNGGADARRRIDEVLSRSTLAGRRQA